MDKFEFHKEFNFRDLSDSCKIKKNRIFRSGALSDLTSKELEILKTFNIKTIIDLRSKKEATQFPDPILPKSHYIRMNPAMDSNGDEMDLSPAGLISIAKKSKGGIHHILKVIQTVYETAPFQNKAYQCMFEQIKNNQFPILIHCSAGKDRTGIACILIMLALGIDEKQIIEEYLLTNQSFADKINLKLKQHPFLSKLSKKIRTIIYCSQGVIANNAVYVLEAIKNKYPTYEEYFKKEFGLDETSLQTIRHYLLEN